MAHVEPLTLEEAEALTAEIDTSQERHWALLAEAKERQIWVPMGYKDFGEYVTAELHMKRSQAYNILTAYSMKCAITDALPDEIALPEVGPTILLNIPRTKVNEVADALTRVATSHKGLTPDTAKEVLRDYQKNSRKKENPPVLDNEVAEKVTSLEGDDLPPYFEVLHDAITVLETSTSERDLYRGFPVLAAAYDRLYTLLTRLESGYEEFESDESAEGA